MVGTAGTTDAGVWANSMGPVVSRKRGATSSPSWPSLSAPPLSSYRCSGSSTPRSSPRGGLRPAAEVRLHADAGQLQFAARRPVQPVHGRHGPLGHHHGHQRRLRPRLGRPGRVRPGPVALQGQWRHNRLAHRRLHCACPRLHRPPVRHLHQAQPERQLPVDHLVLRDLRVALCRVHDAELLLRRAARARGCRPGRRLHSLLRPSAGSCCPWSSPGCRR